MTSIVSVSLKSNGDITSNQVTLVVIMNPLAQHTASELTYEMIDGKILLL